MAGPVALLDANVLYPARLRDLLVRLAIAGLYQARWSEQILDECFENLSADRPDVPAEHLHRTRDLLAVALPDAVVTDYQDLVATFDLPDPDDRHVLAAAHVAEVDFLVTANLADFPVGSMPAGAMALSPDDFVLKLIHADPESVVLGASLLGGGGIGAAVLAAVFISNVPEGLSSAAGMKKAGRPARYVFGVWGGIALASAVSAAIGYATLQAAAPQVLAAITAVAAGAILAVVADTMIPEAVEQAHLGTGLVTAFGFLAAFSIDRVG